MSAQTREEDLKTKLHSGRAASRGLRFSAHLLTCGPRFSAHLLTSREVRMGKRGYLEAVCRCQRLSARAFCPVWDPDTGRPDAMWGATAQPSGQGGYGTCLLKALLWLSLLPQHAQVTTSASSNSATNMTTIQATRNTPSLSQGKQAEARVTPPPK